MADYMDKLRHHGDSLEQQFGAAVRPTVDSILSTAALLRDSLVQRAVGEADAKKDLDRALSVWKEEKESWAQKQWVLEREIVKLKEDLSSMRNVCDRFKCPRCQKTFVSVCLLPGRYPPRCRSNSTI